MDIREVVAKNIRQFRRDRGWSQEDLSFEAGLHRTYISGVERGKRNPTITVLAKVADALNVSVAELVAQR